MAAKKPEIADIENRFAFHPATAVTGAKHDDIRNTLKRVALKFQRDLPDGRHKALALTKLQEAMWAANAAVACDSPAESPDAPADGAPGKRAVKKTAAPLVAPPREKKTAAKKTTKRTMRQVRRSQRTPS